MGSLGTVAIFGSATLMTTVISITAWYVWLGKLQSAALPVREELGEQLNSSLIYLVPLRLFIGVGWLRAAAEKLDDSGWWSGETLAAFLGEHLENGRIAFPIYATLVREIFLPGVVVLAALVVIGELTAGLGILTGTFTNAALLGGIFMNLNFLLIGAPDPSTFYIVIQIVILVSGTGALLGVDRRLSRRYTNRLIFAQRERRTPAGLGIHLFGLTMAVIVGIYALIHVTDTSPAGSVKDPAMVFVILSVLACTWLALSMARIYTDAAQ